MLFDTSILLLYVRQHEPLPARTLLSVIAAAELEVFANWSNWEARRLAATALYFDVELYTADHDFDHLGPTGLRIKKP